MPHIGHRRRPEPAGPSGPGGSPGSRRTVELLSAEGGGATKPGERPTEGGGTIRKTTLLVTLLVLVLSSCGDATDGSRYLVAEATGAADGQPVQTDPTTPSPAEPSGGSSGSDRISLGSLPFSAEAVTVDARGSVYVAGFVPFGAVEETGRRVAMVLEKRDPSGERIWIRRWRSRNETFTDAAGFEVSVSPDGAVVYVAGEIMIPPWEARRVRLWAYSPNGELLWSRQTSRYALGAAAASSSDGVVVGGYGWLGAWDRAGTPVWSGPFEEPSAPHCDEVHDVAIASGAEIYAVGYLDLTPTCAEMEGLALEDADMVIQKRSPSGTLVWSRVLTDPGVTDNDFAMALDVAGRRVFVVGQKDGRAWLARMSPDGRIVWERLWGPSGSVVRPVDVSVAPWGDVYVLADRGPLILRRYGQDGSLVSDRRRRLGMTASAVATSEDETVYVTASDFTGSGVLLRMPP